MRTGISCERCGEIDSSLSVVASVRVWVALPAHNPRKTEVLAIRVLCGRHRGRASGLDATERIPRAILGGFAEVPTSDAFILTDVVGLQTADLLDEVALAIDARGETKEAAKARKRSQRLRSRATAELAHTERMSNLPQDLKDRFGA